MKKVLVVYYTQTGQLKDIVDSLTAPLAGDEEVQVIYERIRPREDFPFPWKAIEFFDAFPESVQEVPCELEPFSFDPSEKFDLVILGYQPWYLSPSIPMTSFLKSEQGKRVLKDKPVVTVLGARNMWVMAQEKMKKLIGEAGGKLRGQIALMDRNKNLVSLVTILAWMLKGQRSGFLGRFPRSGVSEEDIRGAARFGERIREQLHIDINALDQNDLKQLGAMEIDPALLLLEKRGSRAFQAFSGFIRKKGQPGGAARRFRLRLFAACLFPGILVLAPITALTTRLTLLLQRKKLRKEVEQYSGVELRI